MACRLVLAAGLALLAGGHAQATPAHRVEARRHAQRRAAVPAAAAKAAPAEKPKPKPAPEPSTLLGDWDGLRPRLKKEGVTFKLNYLTEDAGTLTALRSGATYVHQIGLRVDVDWAALAGLDGLTMHTEIINRAGNNVTADYAGDNLIYAQEAYGAGIGVPARLALFYGEQKLLDGRVTLSFGRLIPATEYAESQLYCAFMSLTVCGTQRSLNMTQSFSVFPYTVWGSNVKVELGSDSYLRVGVYQSQPQPTDRQPYTQGGRSGWDWTFDGTTGASIPIEVGYEPKLGPEHLPGHYKAGVDYDTSSFRDNFFDRNFQPLVLTGQPGRNHDGRALVWATAEQMVLQSGPYEDDGLSVLAAYSYTQSATSTFRNFAFLGVVDRGIWPSRPRDAFAAGVTYYDVSDGLTRTEELQAALGRPLQAGAKGVQRSALVYEMNYAFDLDNGIELQPDFQFYSRPGASDGVPDAALLGIRTNVRF